MKNKGAKQKGKRKGAKDTAFGCDLGDYLQNSGQDVPQVLKSCAEFIEKHGIVDGVYRLSGITSNIQRLRQEFGTEQRPDLTKEVYLQDIHCVGSLCKLYFRELPNPLLTYELYKKFTEAVSAESEEEQLTRIQNVIKELPPAHYRTLEYLIRHLTHIASFSTKTNMHSRNLALVWAPNLLRSKEIEGSGYNNDAAFLEVRVQSIVIEFILNHVNQLFVSNTVQLARDTEAHNPIAKCKSLPIVSPSMKLLTLEEAQARTLRPDHPARLEKSHCAPMDTGPAAGTIYHTVIDLPDPRRKIPAKTKKWKSIFNLGRSGNDSKGKLSRNGSVFVRGHQFAEKGNIRPAKSMESLCSLPIDDDEIGGRFKHAAKLGGNLSPSLKSCTLGSGGSYSLGRRHSDWDQEDLLGAIGGCANDVSEETPDKESAPLRAQPEQLKVFRGDAFNKSEPTSPKTRRLFYSNNPNDSSAKSNFPGIISPTTTSCRQPQNLKDSALQESTNGTSRDEGSILPVTKDGEGDPHSEQSNSENQKPNDDQEIEKSLLQTEPLTDDYSNSSSQDQPQPFPTLTSQHSDPLQLTPSMSVSSSAAPPDLGEKTTLDGTSAALLTRQPHENGHQTEWSDDMEEQAATIQDTDSSAKAFIEQLWPETKELEIREPDEATAVNNTEEKMEDRLIQPHDKSDIEDKSLPGTTVKPKFKGPQRIHSLPDLFLSSPPPVIENSTEVLCLNATNHISSSEANDTKISDPSLSQLSPSTKPFSGCSKTELSQPISDANILMAPIESPTKWCRGVSMGSFISNYPESNPDQQNDPNSNEKHQCLIAPLELKHLEPCDQDGISNKLASDTSISGTCSEDVFFSQAEQTTVNLSNNECDQKEQLVDIQFSQTPAEAQTEASELLQLEDCMVNETLKQSGSHSPQLDQTAQDGKECSTLMPPIEIPGERQESLSPDVCTDIIAPKDLYDHSSQSANKYIEWNSQSPEFSSQICNGETFENSSNLTNSVQFPNKVDGISVHDQLHVSLTEDNSLASNESDSLCIINAEVTPCLKATEPEPLRITSDRNEECCLKSNDEASLFVLYPMVNDKPPISDSCTIQSIPIGVTAVRMTYMIKTCQVKAIPVIPPKLQFTQIPQPLAKKNLSPPALPLDKVLTILQPITAHEQSSPESKHRLDSSLINSSVAECKDGKENGLSGHECSTTSPDTSLTQSKTTEATPIGNKTCQLNGEDVFNNPTSSKMERSPVQQKPGFLRHAQHRSKAGRPQSLILFSPPWPNMERPSSLDTNKVLLSPVQSSPEQLSPLELDHSAPDSYMQELNDSQNGPDGVTLRSRMSMPKSGQRLETSTSCFYQPQRRSMIFENRGGRQIE
ncbi:rho GTPase-activating protein 31 isoform X2 [Stegostoma tigrinum]|uniref:rho GTPase-activating protein 31 isoform X2 n=1 Tax=Stegostoma tigrinum TaxID=3053191 RepID=UPI00202B5BDA|nr:rho GTPase-activating protein 31 isoform X2 [Stegostoma tigrinum]